MNNMTRNIFSKYDNIAIVGKGAVGQAIVKSLKEASYRYLTIDQFSSSNIDDVYDKSYDLLIYAGVRAFKQTAEQSPVKDKIHILKAADTFRSIDAAEKILISTIDAALDDNQITAYGQNRSLLEYLVLEQNKNSKVLRLPALFGSTVKKNAWYDMIVGPENVTLSPYLAHELAEESRCYNKTLNVLSTVSDESNFIWFNLDTISHALAKLIDSSDRLQMCVSYDEEFKDGIYLTHKELKQIMNYDNVEEWSKARTLHYVRTLTSQPLTFVKSDRLMNDEYWKKVIK